MFFKNLNGILRHSPSKSPRGGPWVKYILAIMCNQQVGWVFRCPIIDQSTIKADTAHLARNISYLEMRNLLHDETLAL